MKTNIKLSLLNNEGSVASLEDSIFGRVEIVEHGEDRDAVKLCHEGN
jgi:hypothetical protein